MNQGADGHFCLNALFLAFAITSSSLMPSASEIRSNVSTVGILSSPSTKLTVCRLSPARAERRFSESFCRNRSSLSRRAISEQIRVRNISSATHNHYKKQRLTKDATRVDRKSTR